MPIENSQALLVVDSEGGFPVYRVRDFLRTIDAAYNYLYVAGLLIANEYLRREAFSWIKSEQERRFGRLVPKADRLILKSVELHSPGNWKFLGLSDVVEQLRLYLQDRHERKKDKTYRIDEDKRSLILANELKALDIARQHLELEKEGYRRKHEEENLQLDTRLKEGELVKQRIEIAKAMGATEEELRGIFERFMRQPLEALDKYQDAGLIAGASIEPEDKGKGTA